MTDDAAEYVLGDAPPQRQDYAAFEYKAPAPDSTGGGYPRWRSWEWREETHRRQKEDVYVPVHRLCAVAWLFPDDWSAADILDSGQLAGADVHHELGLPSANVESELTLVDHGRHSEITQAEMRAYGEDAKRQATDADAGTNVDVCDRCGVETDLLAECAAWPGEQRCLDCAKETNDGERIQV